MALTIAGASATRLGETLSLNQVELVGVGMSITIGGIGSVRIAIPSAGTEALREEHAGRVVLKTLRILNVHFPCRLSETSVLCGRAVARLSPRLGQQKTNPSARL